jgi:hypothetical protein
MISRACSMGGRKTTKGRTKKKRASGAKRLGSSACDHRGGKRYKARHGK